MAKVTVIRDEGLIDKIEVTVNSEGNLTVYAPFDYPIREIRGCLEKNIANIRSKFSSSHHDASKPVQKESVADKKTSDFFTYKRCLIFGKSVDIVCSSDKQRINLSDGKLFVNEDMYMQKESRRKTVQSFLKKIAKEILGRKVSETGSKIRMCPVEINFRPQKGNAWLNCTDACKKIITIDYRAVQLPEHLHSYLILHGYSHFYEGNHSERFYNVLSNFVPEHLDCQNQLENYLFLKDL